MDFFSNLLNNEVFAKYAVGFIVAAVIFIVIDLIKHKPTVRALEARIEALKAENTQLASAKESFDRELELARANALSEASELRAQLHAAEAHSAVPATRVEGWQVVTNDLPQAQPASVESAAAEAHQVALAAFEHTPTHWTPADIHEISISELLDATGLHAGSDYEFAAGGINVHPTNGAGFGIDTNFPVELFRDAIATEAGSLRTAKFEAHAAVVRRHLDAVARTAAFPYSYVPHSEFIDAAYAADSDLADHVRTLGIAILTPETAADIFGHVHSVNHPPVVAEPKVNAEALVSHLELLGAKLREASAALDGAVGSIRAGQNHSDVQRVELITPTDRASGL